MASVAATAPVGSVVADSPIEHGTYFETDSFAVEACGREWAVDASAQGRYWLRAGDDGVPIESFHEVARWSERHVAANGDAFELAARSDNGRTVSIEHVQGNVYRITEKFAGNNFGIYSASGKAAWRDRGLWLQSFEIDTLGDNDPGNDEFVIGSFEASWRGPHFTSDTEPGSLFCTYVDVAVGLG
jgi:hypothetical protein